MIELSKIRFAKLNLNYDRAKLEQEVLAIRSKFKPMPAGIAWARPRKDINVATPEEIAKITVIDPSNNIIQKELPSWEGLSLTHLPNHSESTMGGNRYRNSSRESWTWREDVDVVYLRQIVNELEFEELHSVRIMLLPAGGIGLVHHDSGEAYYINNISITLNVNSGGSPMIFLCEDQQYSVETDPAFLFQDCCLHGVPKVSSNRLQVRINGRPKKELIESLLDLDSIVK